MATSASEGTRPATVVAVGSPRTRTETGFRPPQTTKSSDGRHRECPPVQVAAVDNVQAGIREAERHRYVHRSTLLRQEASQLARRDSEV